MRTEVEIREDIVRRLASLNPDLVLLFGSHATGKAGPESDYDLLVVADGPANPSERVARARKLLRGLGASIDVVVYSPEEWRRHRDARASFAHHAWTTGLVLHGA